MNMGGFSWKRFLGVSAFKGRLSRQTGIPLTKTGQERKIGAALGPVVPNGDSVNDRSPVASWSSASVGVRRADV
jgi:hypothetical protein